MLCVYDYTHCGTNRPNANSRKLALQIQSMYAAMDVVQTLDLADLLLSAFTPERMQHVRRGCSHL